MLKLYSNKEFFTEQNRSFVFPLLFDLHFRNETILSKYFDIVDNIEESDVVVFPLEYSYLLKNNKSYTKTLYNQAKEQKKPIWIYSGGDFGISLNDELIYNFRLGGFKSKLNNRTIIMPSFISDPYELNIKNSFKVLNKEDLPKIGFVGHAKGGFVKFIKEGLGYFLINIKRILRFEYSDYQAFYPSSLKRAKYLKLLQNDTKILSDFILRDKYRAGINQEEAKADTTKEFFENIYNNPYTFCLRGGGNFSVRFYETLAVGRIPVLLDTDCLLPLDNMIEWNKHAFVISERNDNSLSDKLRNLHSKLSPQDFETMQVGNRKLWENYLTRHAFFKHIHDDFINKKIGSHG